MWGYYNVYTAAQIELMAADCPITTYERMKKKGKKGGGKDYPAADAEDVRMRSKEWQEKYKNGTSVTLDLSQFKMR